VLDQGFIGETETRLRVGFVLGKELKSQNIFEAQQRH
jgi:hypothetical protein